MVLGGVSLYLGFDWIAYGLFSLALLKAMAKDLLRWTRRNKPAYQPSNDDAQTQTRREQLLREGRAYARTPGLMTEHEQRFYRHLLSELSSIAEQKGVTESNLRLHSKVRVVDVIIPNEKRYSQGTREHTGLFRQISQWHFDFVLCDDRTQQILHAYELDDRSHQRSDRVRRDNIRHPASLQASPGSPYGCHIMKSDPPSQ